MSSPPRKQWSTEGKGSAHTEGKPKAVVLLAHACAEPRRCRRHARAFRKWAQARAKARAKGSGQAKGRQRKAGAGLSSSHPDAAW